MKTYDLDDPSWGIERPWATGLAGPSDFHYHGHMSRTDTIRALVETLSTEGEALAYPDHPLVLDGPYLLTLVEGVLTASFVYTRGSRPANSVAEQARVLLARLAYPGHTVSLRRTYSSSSLLHYLQGRQSGLHLVRL